MTAVYADQSDLRSEQRNVTQRRIARAVLEIILEVGAGGVSFPRVANLAKTSLRTVYRHFPNKDLLLAAAMAFGGESATNVIPESGRTVAAMSRFVPLLWSELNANIDVVRLEHMTSAGVELRGQRMRSRREEITATLGREQVGVNETDRALLASLLTCMVGSSMMLDFVEQLDVSVEDGARVTAFAMIATVEAALNQGGIPQ